MSPPRHPFAIARFRQLWLLTIVANMTALVQAVAAAWMMTAVGSPVQVALIQSAIALPASVLALLAGALADMADRRRMMLASYIFMLLPAAALAIHQQWGGASPGALLIACFLFGCGSALFGPAAMAHVGESVPEYMLAEGVGAYGIGFNVARILGPVVGGFLVGTVGPAATLALNAIACAAMIMLLLPLEPGKGWPQPRRIVAVLKEGIGFVGTESRLWPILARSFAFTVAASPIWALIPHLSRDRLGGNAVLYGMLMGAVGIGAILICIFLGQARRRIGVEGILGVSAVANVLCLMGLAVADNSIVAALLLLPLGAAWVGCLNSWNIAVQLLSPAALAGRVIGTYYTALFAGVALGSWLWGETAERFGLTIAFAAAAVLSGLAGLAGRRWPTTVDICGEKKNKAMGGSLS
ncbi:MAG: MFS transporter [Sphingobium sp.]|nr:MFS transporter [Sphingobium sp.]